MGQTTAAAGGTGADFACAARRNRFFSRFPIRSYHEAEQVHGAGLRVVGSRSAGYRGVDGLLASRAGALLSMRTADCWPVFLRDPGGNRFALLHAGWRGLADSIVRRAVERWFPRGVLGLAGCGVGPEAYEVGAEVLDALGEALELSRKGLRRHGILRASNRVDLGRVVECQLRRADPPVEDFCRVPLTTDESPVPMFSHRRDRTPRRMVHWIYRPAEFPPGR